MNALRTNLIVKEIEQQVEDLVQVCNAYDGTHGEIKLDNSIQYYPEMNNLFLMFDEELLIGAIKLFGIFRESVELSGYTHPDYRKSGVFKALLTEVFKEIQTYGFRELLYVIDTGSISGIEWAEKKNLTYQSTEVTMRLLNDSTSKKTGQKVFMKRAEEVELPVLVALHDELFGLSEKDSEKYLKKVMDFSDKDFYFMMDENSIIGLGGIYRDGGKAVLFGFGIRERFRGKGYSKVLIGELIDIARGLGFCEIELEVDQDNHRAYNLYKNAGFVEYYSMSYYRAIL